MRTTMRLFRPRRTAAEPMLPFFKFLYFFAPGASGKNPALGMDCQLEHCTGGRAARPTFQLHVQTGSPAPPAAHSSLSAHIP